VAVLNPSGVRLDRDGPVATVTLCRPHVLNAQTPAMWRALREIGRDLGADVRVVVVRGEGRAFSAGLDLAEVSTPAPDSATSDPATDPATDAAGNADAGTGDAGNGDAGNGDSGGDGGSGGPAAGRFSFAGLVQLDDDAALATIEGFQRAFSWLRRPDLISIAAVRGHAIGAGFQLALACDLRVLAEDAQLTMAEVTLGLVPDLGGTKRLVELVGYARALEICVTGRRVGAAEADRIGLATLVVPAGDLDAAVAVLAAQILVARRDAVVEVKALLAAASSREFPAQEAAERAAQVRRIRDLVGQGD
jgi:enoyl-CoA hydratase/carnithine racemase